MHNIILTEPSSRKQQGIYIVAISLVLLLSLTVLSLFIVRNIVTAQRISANDYRSIQAFEAADAGIEYGFAYLQKNVTTLLVDTDNNGVMDNYNTSGLTAVALPNNATYTVRYTNPVLNNLQLIKITSTGTSADGTVTKRITQLVKMNSLFLNMPNSTITIKLNADIGGSGTISNLNTPNPPYNIKAGQDIAISGTAVTATNSGASSNKTSLASDASEYNASISSMTNDQFFSSVFGVPKTAMRSLADTTYQSNVNTNYSSQLDGLKGKIVWIDQADTTTATLNGSIIVGSTAEPVLLIVNGDLKLTGSVIFYGYIYTVQGGDIDISGSVTVYGGIGAETNFRSRGSMQIHYDVDVINNLKQHGLYGKVPGGWQDFLTT